MSQLGVDGRYIATAIGCDLAADAIGRQEPIGLTRSTLERSLGSRPGLVVIAVPAGTEDDVAAAIRPLLDGDAEPGPPPTTHQR